MKNLRVRIVGAAGALVRDLRFSKFPITIGSDEGLSVTLEEAQSSRIHAQVEVRDDGLWYVDLGSEHGSFSEEGLPIFERRIENKMAVRIGNTWIAFRISNEQRSQTRHRAQNHTKNHTKNQTEPWSRAFEIAQHRHALLAGFALLAASTLYSAEASLYGLRVLMNVAGAAAVAMIASALSWALMRAFRKEALFQPLFRFYLSYTFLQLAISILAQSATLLHPEGSLVPSLKIFVGGSLLAFVFFMNLHWIGRVDTTKLRMGFALCLLLSLLFAYDSYSKRGPRWTRLLSHPELVHPLVVAPIQALVPTQEFLSEMDQSFLTLDANIDANKNR
jgi:hypothetical protein